MSGEELNRLQSLGRVMERRLTQAKAAEPLGLSLRQVERRCRKLRLEGPDELVSDERGPPSSRKLPDSPLWIALPVEREALFFLYPRSPAIATGSTPINAP
jgi:hypothetical protein